MYSKSIKTSKTTIDVPNTYSVLDETDDIINYAY